MYANIQKFIQFQLTVNVAALVINVVAAISAGDVPLTAVQVRYDKIIFYLFLSKTTKISMSVKSVLPYLCSSSGSIL